MGKVHLLLPYDLAVVHHRRLYISRSQRMSGKTLQITLYYNSFARKDRHGRLLKGHVVRRKQELIHHKRRRSERLFPRIDDY